jgi:hypothetical protein
VMPGRSLGDPSPATHTLAPFSSAMYARRRIRQAQNVFNAQISKMCSSDLARRLTCSERARVFRLPASESRMTGILGLRLIGPSSGSSGL